MKQSYTSENFANCKSLHNHLKNVFYDEMECMVIFSYKRLHSMGSLDIYANKYHGPLLSKQKYSNLFPWEIIEIESTKGRPSFCYLVVVLCSIISKGVA